ncbi:J domain-containing protein [Pseudaquabacterium rugosum]|uniref:J domain-containing protein n=1 Tax=Pseudaquabacterium rugosum TaxID=2984194 RepID=A0ABU9BGU2_9BURK
MIDIKIDHYRNLGISPDAEDVVIRAAFRALAQRYHPDRWQGEQGLANSRMMEINQAYEILGDAARKKAYDEERRLASLRSAFDSCLDPDVEAAFDSALEEVGERWAVALSVFPDLALLRNNLEKYSRALAFSFVTVILDSKKFQDRDELAREMERRFLEVYFGSDHAVVGFAKELINSGRRDAALRLNKLVDVMGSDVDSELLIKNVEQAFGVLRSREQTEEAHRRREHLLKLVAFVNFNYADQSIELARAFGYKVSEKSVGFWSGAVVVMCAPNGEILEFKGYTPFVEWVKINICPKV